jgi:hypothetical protein
MARTHKQSIVLPLPPFFEPQRAAATDRRTCLSYGRTSARRPRRPLHWHRLSTRRTRTPRPSRRIAKPLAPEQRQRAAPVRTWRSFCFSGVAPMAAKRLDDAPFKP